MGNHGPCNLPAAMARPPNAWVFGRDKTTRLQEDKR